MSTALRTDRYELTMLDTALSSGVADHRAVFEVFARGLPAGRRYGVVAGLGRLVGAIENFQFGGADVAWLVGEGIVRPETGEWLRAFRFGGDLDAYTEGECFFPGSPVLTIEAPFAEAVLLETVVLSILNFDSAVAAAASRIVGAAEGRPVIEMGSRRTHEEAAVSSARAAYIGGCASTSNLEAGRAYGIPTAGTAAHSFILAYENERQAFAAQLDTMGLGTTLLVDTYDTAKAIATAVELARERGGEGPAAIRLDSGDLLEEASRARAQLDDLGAKSTAIVVTSDLDEYAIAGLAGAPVDGYGVGTRMATGSGAPTAGFVYKLVAVAAESGLLAPLHAVEKRSPAKHSLGARKHASRWIDEEGQARVEFVRPLVEVAEGSRDTTLSAIPGRLPDELPEGWAARDLQHRVMSEGSRAEALPSLADSREHHRWSLRELGAEAFDLKPGGPMIPTRYGRGGDRKTAPAGRMGVVREIRPGAAGPSVDVAAAEAEAEAPRALLVVDVQEDFCEGGPLAVPGGDRVAGAVAALVESDPERYAAVLASRDWHVNPGTHFAQAGAVPDLETSWPVHCVAGSQGAGIHSALGGVVFAAIFDKGAEEAAYSAFEGRSADGASLATWLLDHRIDRLDICGIATDFCVRATVLDACQLGFRVRVLVDLTAGVAPTTTAQALTAMAEAGAELVGDEIAVGTVVGTLAERFAFDER